MNFDTLFRSLSVAILTCCLWATAHSQDIDVVGKESKRDFEQRINSLFGEFNDATPGVAIAVIRDGEVVLKKSYGCMDIERREPISSSTIFSLASVSKQFTAFAVMLLESEGKLDLDDDVRTYLPELPKYGKPISLRQMANHTSGIRSQLQMLGMKGLNPSDPITEEMVHRIIFRQRELNFPPGEEFNYSNSGYVLLAEVVTRVSGMPFAEYVQRRILQPLEMDDSFVVQDAHEPVENLAIAYNFERGTYVAVPTNDSVVGSTGLFTSIEDLAKWVQNFDDPVVGTKEIFNEMSRMGVLNDGTKCEYGLGQFIGKHRNEAMIFHAGADSGFVAFVVRFPKRSLSVMLLGNCSSIDAQRMSLQIAESFLPPPPESDLSRANADEAAKPIEVAPQQLEKFVGEYLDPRNHIARSIAIKKNSLIYARPEQNGRETVLMPLKERVFGFKGATDVKVVFGRSESKRTMDIIVDKKVVEHYVEHSFSKPTTAELKGFSGRYFSDELEATYVVDEREGKLFVAVPRIGRIPLEAIEADGFCTQGYPFNYLKFSRGENGTVQGFRVSSGRAKNILFKKRDR